MIKVHQAYSGRPFYINDKLVATVISRPIPWNAEGKTYTSIHLIGEDRNSDYSVSESVEQVAEMINEEGRY